MPLDEYRRKRDFDRTPEPSGDAAAPGAPGDGEAEGGAGLSYLVQEHRASRHHFDFRLELDGVLLSWAVPKGPSLDPGERRLAVHVEDHPLAYGGFEGIIPENQYGGGTVLLWDRGSWQPDGGVKAARKGMKKGELTFRLAGEKLTGGWRLVRMNTDDGDNWLLIKRKDEAARPGEGDALQAERPESVASGRTMEEIAADPDRVWDSRTGERAPRADESAATTAPLPDPESVPGARRGAAPTKLGHQLATLAAAPPGGEDWLHEIKYDGYRVFCHLAPGKDGPVVRLLTRGGKDWTARFPAIAAGVRALARARAARSALLDGEIVAFLPDGRSDFSSLQEAISEGRDERLHFVIFDLLALDGWHLDRAPLSARKRLLAELLAEAPAGASRLRYSDHVAGGGGAFHRQACRFRLEGVIAKRADAPYRPGRGKDWLKVKCLERQELVIGGFTDPSGSRSGFGSLLVGHYDGDGDLRYAGKVGTGFKAAQLRDLSRRLAALERATPPFADPPRGQGLHWTDPELVAEVAFTEWTRDGVLRHPSFQGLREDKDARSVVRERPVAPSGPQSQPKAAKTKTSKEKPMASRPKSRSAGAAIEVAGVRLTSPDRILYPDQGATKRDLAAYYEEIAEWALPHLAARPLSLVRCPAGRTGECFFQKHIDKSFPAALDRIEVPEKDGVEIYAGAHDAAGLVGLVQMGVLEIHPWGSRADRLERPDRLVFDLDPGPGLAWVRVVEGAFELRETLSELGLASFLKTTGGKGLHLVVPIDRTIGWEAAKGFAHAVVERLAERAPRRYTTNVRKEQREGKIYLDYLRNARGATAIAPYSPRARPGATVATPIAWDELTPRLAADRYTVASVPRRLRALGADPWADLATTRQRITAGMRRALGIG